MKSNPFLNKKSNDRFIFLDNISEKEKEKEKVQYNNNNFVTKKYEPITRFKSSRQNNKLPVTNFVLIEQDFPSLNNNNNITFDHSTSNYKDIIASNESNTNLSQQNNIPPGCIEISKINGKCCIKNGPLTPYQIKVNNLNKYQEYLSNDSNYIMNNAINYMKNNWEKYKLEYDSVYGEGSYEDKFIYKNDYELDYDSDTASEIDNDLDIDLIEQYEKDYLV